MDLSPRDMRIIDLYGPRPLLKPHGRWLVLDWYNYNLAHNASFARTEEQLLQVWDRVYDKKDYRLRITGLKELVPVVPPLDIRRAFALDTYSAKLSSLRWFLAYTAKKAFEETGKLLQHTSLCTRYKSRYDADDDPSNTRAESEDQEHWSCVNCVERIVLSPVLPLEELFWRHYESYHATLIAEKLPTPYLWPKNGTLPVEGEPLYVMTQHSSGSDSGIRYTELTPGPELSHVVAQENGNQLICFAHLHPLEVPKAFYAVMKKHNDANKPQSRAEFEREKRRRTEEHTRKELLKFKRVEALLSDIDPATIKE